MRRLLEGSALTSLKTSQALEPLSRGAELKRGHTDEAPPIILDHFLFLEIHLVRKPWMRSIQIQKASTWGVTQSHRPSKTTFSGSIFRTSNLLACSSHSILFVQVQVILCFSFLFFRSSEPQAKANWLAPKNKTLWDRNFLRWSCEIPCLHLWWICCILHFQICNVLIIPTRDYSGNIQTHSHVLIIVKAPLCCGMHDVHGVCLSVFL